MGRWKQGLEFPARARSRSPAHSRLCFFFFSCRLLLSSFWLPRPLPRTRVSRGVTVGAATRAASALGSAVTARRPRRPTKKKKHTHTQDGAGLRKTCKLTISITLNNVILGFCTILCQHGVSLTVFAVALSTCLACTCDDGACLWPTHPRPRQCALKPSGAVAAARVFAVGLSRAAAGRALRAGLGLPGPRVVRRG